MDAERQADRKSGREKTNIGKSSKKLHLSLTNEGVVGDREHLAHLKSGPSHATEGIDDAFRVGGVKQHGSVGQRIRVSASVPDSAFGHFRQTADGQAGRQPRVRRQSLHSTRRDPFLLGYIGELRSVLFQF